MEVCKFGISSVLSVSLVAALGFALLIAGDARSVPSGSSRKAHVPLVQQTAEKTTAASHFSAAAQRRRREIFAQVQGDQAFERLPEPQPGQWLWHFRERGQTLHDYALTEGVNWKSSARRRLEVLPYDDLSASQRRLLPLLREYLQIFFAGLDIKVLRSTALERRFFDPRRKQYDADRIAQALARRVPVDSLGLFGLTGRDLYALELNYVFGIGLFRRRAGVHSLYRYGDQRAKLFERMLKVASHELGHMLTLEHCVFYRCNLNGSNSLAEMDRQPMHYCPVCLAKLQRNLGFDPIARYRKLAAFYRRHGLAQQARFAAARAAQPKPSR